MSELTEFLLARVSEDEAVARAAAEGIPIHYSKPPGLAWEVNPGAREGAGVDGAEVELWDTENGYLVASEGAANHIARHDPARVLRECEAKRRIVELHNPNGVHRCITGHVTFASDCREARVLAAVYVDHPDYRDEWKP